MQESLALSFSSRRIFKQRLILAVVVPLLLSVVTGGMAVWQLRDLLDASDQVDKSNKTIAALYGVQGLLVDMETGVRGYLLTGRQEFLQPYQKAEAQLDTQLTEVSRFLADSGAQDARLAELQSGKDNWLRLAESLVHSKERRGLTGTALQHRQAKRIMDGTRFQLEQIIMAEEMLRDDRIEKAQSVSRLVITVILLVAVGAGVAVAFFIRHQLLGLSASYNRAFNEFEEKSHALQESQERFYTTLKSIGDAVIATDARGLVTFMNPVAEVLTGWSAAEALRRKLGDIFNVVSEETREAVANPVEQVLREGQPVNVRNNIVLIGRQGHESIIENSATPIRSDAQRLLGAVLVFRDATRKARYERQQRFITSIGSILMASLDYAQTLQKVAEQSVPEIADWCAIDMVEEGEIKRVATAHTRAHKVGELSGRSAMSLETSDTMVAKVMRTGKAMLLRHITDQDLAQAARDEDHLRELKALGLASAMVVPLAVQDRVMGTMTFVSEDINELYDETDLAFAEQIAHRASFAIDNALLYAESQKSNRIKDEFLATLSHELRTPLNVIQGWTSLLENEPSDTATFRMGFEALRRNSGLLGEIINDLLDVSRVITGKLQLNIQDLNFRNIIESTLESLRFAAEAKGVTVETHLDSEAGALSGDEGRLQQIVWNLISNAIKFSRRGDKVEVNLKLVESRVEFTVSDTGQGIDAKFLPFVFDRFRQEDSSSTRAHGGLGLGLAIVKQLVELHGGRVFATSRGRNSGSTFTVILPLLALQRTKPLPPRLPEPRLEHVLPDEPSLEGVRVVLVEDSDDSRALIQHVLENAGAIVYPAASADEGLDHVLKFKPDIILSDIGMPGENGYTMMKKIRSLPRDDGGGIPAVALTAYARDEERKMALSAGFQVHVSKPVDPPTLIWALTRLLPKNPTPGNPRSQASA